MPATSSLSRSISEVRVDSLAPPAELATRNGIPRLAEALISLAALTLFAPLIAVAAVTVVVTSGSPAIFRQERVGYKRRNFVLYKLRTMRASLSGPQVTSKCDNRVTAIGRLLRRTKIDELPQLWNVLKGDMSLVGPRPEVPKYVDVEDPRWRLVLTAKPGITDPVSMRLRNEEQLLADVKGDSELFYLEVLQPLKLDGYIEYLQQRNWRRDVRILWLTAVTVVFPRRAPATIVGKPITMQGASRQ